MTISIKAARENLLDTAGKHQLQGKSIPDDVIEAILSRLPVKSVIRFQILSKLCKAIISTPSFAKINYNHLPKSHNLFLRKNLEEELFSLVRLEGASNLQKEAEFGAPFGPALPLCSCNGIVLLVTRNSSKPCGEFVLWNPCIRKYTMIPIPLPEMNWLNAGLYHDSTTDDYRVLVISGRGNMVYSCKTRTWVEEELIPRSQSAREGVLVDGCLYWHKEPHHILSREILCFDFRGRKMEELKLPNGVCGQLGLTRLQGCLCLNPVDIEDQVWVRENGGWREVSNMVKPGIQLCNGRIIVMIANHKVASIGYSSNFLLYNDPEERFEESEIPDVCCEELVPYSESLLFPF